MCIHFFLFVCVLSFWGKKKISVHYGGYPLVLFIRLETRGCDGNTYVTTRIVLHQKGVGLCRGFRQFKANMSPQKRLI